MNIPEIEALANKAACAGNRDLANRLRREAQRAYGKFDGRNGRGALSANGSYLDDYNACNDPDDSWEYVTDAEITDLIGRKVPIKRQGFTGRMESED